MKVHHYLAVLGLWTFVFGLFMGITAFIAAGGVILMASGLLRIGIGTNQTRTPLNQPHVRVAVPIEEPYICPVFEIRLFEQKMVDAGLMQKHEMSACESLSCNPCLSTQRALLNYQDAKKQREFADHQRRLAESAKRREAERRLRFYDLWSGRLDGKTMPQLVEMGIPYEMGLAYINGDDFYISSDLEQVWVRGEPIKASYSKNNELPNVSADDGYIARMTKASEELNRRRREKDLLEKRAVLAEQLSTMRNFLSY